MKKSEIQVGGKYVAKVSGKLVVVRVDGIRDLGSRADRFGYEIHTMRYDVTNLSTGRKTTFRSAAKFRKVAAEIKLSPGPATCGSSLADYETPVRE